MEKITIQYIAGFFDGEGSIGIYSRKDRKDGFHLRTQLAQNKSKESTVLMNYLVSKFGGSLSEQITLSEYIKYNWQLNSVLAVNFLEEVAPHLILKKDQAYIAVAWQKQRPKRTRDKLGRICLKKKKDIGFDLKVSSLIKALKRADIETVMSNQTDLVKIVTKLTPLAVIKG